MISPDRQLRPSFLLPALLTGMVILCLALFSHSAAGQTEDSGSIEEETPAESAITELIEPEPVELPSLDVVARVLSDAALREDALLTLAAVMRQKMLPADGGAETSVSTARDFVADLAWLNGLVGRYHPGEPRSHVLDPAAWRVLLQVEAHGMQTSALTAPPGPEMEIYLRQVFDRSNTRQAAAVLPGLLWQLDASATLVWQELLIQAESDEALVPGIGGLSGEAFAHWYEGLPIANGESDAETAAEPDTEAESSPQPDPIAVAVWALQTMVLELTGMGPPNPALLADVRYQLLLAMPGLDEQRRLVAKNLLHMATVLDGIHERRYFQYVQGLLAIMTDIERHWPDPPDPALPILLADAEPVEPVEPEVQPLAWLNTWLTQVLPDVSAAYARDFANVDPRLNSAIASAFDVGRGLGRAPDLVDHPRLKRQLADAVARLALLVPDMAYYFDQPIRDPIAGGVDACSGIVASTDPDGSPSMTRELFDDCQQTLLDLADDEARQAQLAGDPDGPFGATNLERELGLTPGQRINYGIGYLLERYSTGCEAPLKSLPNPLEWAYLATFMAWFSEQSPLYFQTPENEQRLMAMRAIGNELIRGMAEQVDCIADAGAGVNDPVFRALGDYRDQLAMLGRSLDDAEGAFRELVLEPGADIALERGATQNTAYRPDNLEIGPCDLETACEMTGQLSSTRALMGLFPKPYLVADQAGMGQVDICYDQVQWADRRSQAVRPGDENVANYYGRLAFNLKGRFLDESGTTDLFAFHFTSPDEYHYMFAAANDEVLDDSCPVEWIGERIVTPLPDRRFGIVPNRLTYLSAARTQPSRLLTRNWDTGAEWRDWFVTGIGVETLDIPEPPDVRPALEQHLQTLYAREQAAIYGRLLLTGAPGTGNSSPLQEEMALLNTDKDLLRMQMMLFYSQVMAGPDEFRAFMVGQVGLLDTTVLKRFREENVPVEDILEISYTRLDLFQERWAEQPEAVRRNGTIQTSVAQAMMRLNALYYRYFSVRAEPETRVLSAPPAETP